MEADDLGSIYEDAGEVIELDESTIGKMLVWLKIFCRPLRN
jgi:hypothetical protein